MKLDLSEILGRVGMRYPYAVDEPPIVDEDLECAAPVRGEIVFNNTGNVLLLDGGVETRVVLPCSRCLEYYEEPVKPRVSEQFTLEMKANARGRQTATVVEDDENPDAARLFDGQLFDLTEMLRQAIMLELPTRPLHDEACKGLCAQCGANLNETTCGCVTRNVNPALAKLGALLKDDGA